MADGKQEKGHHSLRIANIFGRYQTVREDKYWCVPDIRPFIGESHAVRSSSDDKRFERLEAL